MKRGLCCLCAVALCTAVALADTPTKERVETSPAPKLVTSFSNPAVHADKTAQAAGPVQAVQSGTTGKFVSGSRQGGDDCTTATVLSGPLPIVVLGTTVGYTDDYDTVCEITSYPGAPDVVYSWTPDATDFYSISLCEDATDYDTKLYVRTDCASGVDVACSDDACSTASYPSPYVSRIDSVELTAGTTYYIIIDGWDDSESGNYELKIDTALPAAPLPECPPDSTLVGQRAYGEEEAWSVYVSNDKFPDFNPANGIKLIEHFGGIGGQIEDIHWWGVGAVYDDQGYLVECPLDPGNFLIEFYLNDPDTNRPDYATGPVYTFVANAASGLTKVDTENVYSGADDDYTLWFWGIDLPVPYFAFEGWIAIQNLDLCPFWWAGSPEGGTIHVMWDEATDAKTDESGDLAYCLTATDIGPFTGACCDESSGVCRDTDATDCVGAFDVWYQGQTCAEITCTAVPAACCIGTSCLMLDQSGCESAGGVWYPDFNCTVGDPNYKDCQETGGGSDVCEDTVAYGQDLVQGYSWLYPSSIENGIAWFDNFSGLTAPITRVGWWASFSDGAASCDPPEPLTVRIRFWQTIAGSDPIEPDIAGGPYCTFDSTANFGSSGWTFGEPYGTIYQCVTILPGSCDLADGWVTIQQIQGGSDCLMWDLSSDWVDGIAWEGDPDDGSPPVEYWPSTPEDTSTDMCFCLYTDVRTGACCYEDYGTCEEAAEEPTCLSTGGVFYPDKLCSEITCEPQPGACCNQEAEDTCVVNLKSECDAMGAPWVWLGPHTTCADCCVVLCDDGEILEGEPTCFDGYVDEYNYGCFTDPTWTYPDDWLPIAVGDVYCAEMGTYTTGGTALRDFDWYTLTLSDTVGLIKAHVKAEFPADVYLLWPDPFDEGDGYCPAYVISEGVGLDCADVIASGALPAGTYYIAVSCFGDVTCGTLYNLWYEVLPAGKCEIDPDICFESSENVCLALGGTWTAGEACTAGCGGQLLGDANCDGLVNAFDIDAFILAITDPAGWEAVYGSGGAGCDILCVVDCNQDGSVNAFDIDPFIAILTGK